jgi:GAF domain-containing protein
MTVKKMPDGSCPAPLPADEAERLKALQEFQVLDSMPEQAFDDIVFLASHICQTPIALVSLIDSDRQWFKARVGLGPTQTSRDLAFCAHAILEPDRVMQVQDATKDERFRTNPLVTGSPDIRFYAGTPLVTPDGRAIGTLCAIDRKPRELTADQLRALKALSREVMVQLELRRTILTLQQALTAAGAARAPARPPDENPAQRARDLVAKMGDPGTEVEDRMRTLLARMQLLQKRSSTPTAP